MRSRAMEACDLGPPHGRPEAHPGASRRLRSRERRPGVQSRWPPACLRLGNERQALGPGFGSSAWSLDPPHGAWRSPGVSDLRANCFCSAPRRSPGSTDRFATRTIASIPGSAASASSSTRAGCGRSPRSPLFNRHVFDQVAPDDLSSIVVDGVTIDAAGEHRSIAAFEGTSAKQIWSIPVPADQCSP